MEYENYRGILRGELNKRKELNSSYSLRAFARDLEISAPRLSQILSEKSGLSIEAAKSLVKKLNLSDDEAEFFIASVGAVHTRSLKEKNKYSSRFKELRQSSVSYNNLQLDYFKVISDWYHYAILELTYLDDFKNDSDWMAEVLSIDVKLVDEAIHRLKSLELVEEVDGQLKDCFVHLATPNDTPSQSLKKFNSQLMKKATEALYLQGVSEREISSTVLAISKAKLPQLKEKIRSFRREFSLEQQTETKDAVYCLGIQFFNLSNIGDSNV